MFIQTTHSITYLYLWWPRSGTKCSTILHLYQWLQLSGTFGITNTAMATFVSAMNSISLVLSVTTSAVGYLLHTVYIFTLLFCYKSQLLCSTQQFKTMFFFHLQLRTSGERLHLAEALTAHPGLDGKYRSEAG